MRIEEIEREIKKADHKIAEVRDEIEEESEIRCSKGENYAFYSTVSRTITRLQWELDQQYEARRELIAKLKALYERRNELHRKLEQE